MTPAEWGELLVWLVLGLGTAVVVAVLLVHVVWLAAAGVAVVVALAIRFWPVALVVALGAWAAWAAWH